ncbi:MAG: Card1-like endonuclease domain-containing protein [Desulfotomaculales bacterium]
MIALVSEQRMQNIIPCYQKGLTFTEVHLVRSLEAETPGSSLSRAWQNTKEVLKDMVRVQDVEPAVDAFNVGAAQATIRAAIEQLTGKGLWVVVNFTGGTKCMSVGAFLAAMETGCPALYVDTDHERLIWYNREQQIAEHKFDLRPITVPFYLAAYGLTCKEPEQQEQPQRLSKLIHLILKFWPLCVPILEELAEVAKKKSELPSSLRESHEFANEFINLLFQFKLLDEKNGKRIFTKDGVDFITGDWLELTVYHLLRSHSKGVGASFDDVQWSVKAELEKVGNELEKVENELDVVLTRRGQLFVIECKSGDLRGSARQATLNKLEALRYRLGRFTRLVFVTSRPAGEVPSSFKARVKEYGIKFVVARENLKRLPELLAGQGRVNQGCRAF